MRRKVTERLAQGAGLTVAEIRDLLGTTRKYAVPLCEYLDRTGVTKREGDLRFDPGVRPCQSILQTDDGFPVEHLAQSSIVRVASAHTLRPWDVDLVDRDSGDCRGLAESDLVVGEKADREVQRGLFLADLAFEFGGKGDGHGS